MEVYAISHWPACAALMCVGCLASFQAKHESEASRPEGIAHRSLIDRVASVALRETVMDHRKSASTSETGCVVADIELYKQTPRARGPGARMPSEVAFPFVCFCRCPFWVPRKGPAPRPWAPGSKPRAARVRHRGWGCLGSAMR